MKFRKSIAAAVLVLAAAGCAQSDYGPKQTFGGLSGAALGGLLGAQFGSGEGRLVTTGAGVLLGALVGSEIGRSMDHVDRMRANEAVTRSYSAPLGETIYWNNPRSGYAGTVTPMRDGTSARGQYCREFRQTITIDGRLAEGVGTACRQADGTWRIVS